MTQISYPCRLQQPGHQTIEDTSASNVPPLVRLWLLRMLVDLQGVRPFALEMRQGWHGPEEQALLRAIGLDDLAECSEQDTLEKVIDIPDLIRDIKKRYHEQERQHHRHPFSPPVAVATNIRNLAELIGLDQCSEQILLFLVVLQCEPSLNKASEFINHNHLPNVLATLTGQSPAQVRAALEYTGPLVSSGLVNVDWDTRKQTGLSEQFELLNGYLLGCLYHHPMEPQTLLQELVVEAPSPQLALSDFEHLGLKLNTLRDYLKAVLRGKTGANILLYGPPGTGKTQLAVTLSDTLGARLMTLPSEDVQQPSVSRQLRRLNRGTSARMAEYCIAQSLLRNSHNTLLLFDEIEDIFYESMGSRNGANSQKGRTHQVLETNPVPAIWISNSVDAIDPAIIRRFDLVLEIPVPPKQQRKRIIQRIGKPNLSTETIGTLAELDELTPAVVARAVNVSRLVSENDTLDEPVMMLVGETLKAQGHTVSTPIKSRATSGGNFEPEYLSIDAEPGELVTGLRRCGEGRLCFNGPPGTGKTAFGHWLADELDRPLHVKRYSDLSSCLVGVAEKNIAKAFADAEAEGAVLLLDEVDSFLQDRRQAHASWEITVVNEMLTQMESFSGLFIASTNLVDCLDAASLRRFDIKLEFGYLSTNQAESLWRRCCQQLNLPRRQADVALLRTLTHLTPGDFASATRRHRFQTLRDGKALINALVDECALKKEGRTYPIGFIR